MKNFNEHESDWTFGKAKTVCYCSSIYSPLFISLGICNYFIDSLPSNIMILSQNWKEISFNLFLYFLVPDSGILKLAVRLKKKRISTTIFSCIFEALFLGGQAPSTAPILCCVNLIIWTKTFKTWLFEQKRRYKRTWFLFLLWRLNFSLW